MAINFIAHRFQSPDEKNVTCLPPFETGNCFDSQKMGDGAETALQLTSGKLPQKAQPEDTKNIALQFRI
jgi:hypothetical protein